MPHREHIYDTYWDYPQNISQHCYTRYPSSGSACSYWYRKIQIKKSNQAGSRVQTEIEKGRRVDQDVFGPWRWHGSRRPLEYHISNSLNSKNLLPSKIHLSKYGSEILSARSNTNLQNSQSSDRKDSRDKQQNVDIPQYIYRRLYPAG